MTHYKTLWCRQNHSTDRQIKYLLMLAMITCHGFGFQFSYFPVLNWKTPLSFISLIYTSCLCLLPACFLCSPVFRLLISLKATNIKGLFKWQWFENDFCSALLCEGSRAVNLCMFREKGCWLLSLWAIGCASLHCSRSPPFVLHWFVKALNGIHRWFFFLFFFLFLLTQSHSHTCRRRAASAGFLWAALVWSWGLLLSWSQWDECLSTRDGERRREKPLSITTSYLYVTTGGHK